MIFIENDDLVLDDSEVVDLIFEVSIDDEQVLIFEIFDEMFLSIEKLVWMIWFLMRKI